MSELCDDAAINQGCIERRLISIDGSHSDPGGVPQPNRSRYRSYADPKRTESGPVRTDSPVRTVSVPYQRTTAVKYLSRGSSPAENTMDFYKSLTKTY